MSLIQERERKVLGLKDKVLNHPMCGKFFDNGTAYIIHYPAGDFSVDGLKCRQDIGKAVALEKLLARMEHDWLASFPNRK